MNKILQIIPCERGWHTRQYVRLSPNEKIPEGATTCNGLLLRDGNLETINDEIACWALLDSGEVVPMVADGSGLSPIQNSDVNIYSPAESWRYGITGQIDELPRGARGDVELIAVTESEDSFTFVWRWIS